MRLRGGVLLSLLLVAFAPCNGDIDVTDSLFGHIVYFKNHKSASWLGLTDDHETMTIDIGEDNIHFYNPGLGLRNKFDRPAETPNFKIVENHIRIDDNGGSMCNKPPEPSRNFLSGREVEDVNYLQDRNVNPVKFWKRNENETYSKEMQWRVVCRDEWMEDCSIMNVRYHEFLFSDGANATVGTRPGCNEGDGCPHECETNEDCRGRGQCVSCQNNECRVSEECCTCLSCPCDQLFTDPESNSVCQKEIKCGLCGEHCSDVTDPCPIEENRVCVKPVDPPSRNVTEPLDPEFRWKVIVPGFTSNVTIIHESGCNKREKEVFERIRFKRGIVMHEGASWDLSESVANDVWTRVEMGNIEGEGAERWKEELENSGTWSAEGVDHLAITIPYGHKAVVRQLQGKYGNPLDPVYSVYGNVDVVQIDRCYDEERDCLPHDGSESPECPVFPGHNWRYEPKETHFRPHESDCSLYWECIPPLVDDEGTALAAPEYCLRRCGLFSDVRSTTFDWGFGKGSMECIWEADCSYLNQTRPATTTTTTRPQRTTTTTTTTTSTVKTTKSTTTSTTTKPTTTSTTTTTGLCGNITCDQNNIGKLYQIVECGESYCKCDHDGPVEMPCADGGTAFCPETNDCKHNNCDWKRNNKDCKEYNQSRLWNGDRKSP